MQKYYAYIDDKIVSADDAKLPLTDLSILRGYGIFDYLRTYQNIPFHLSDHLKRFRQSAESIGLSLPKPLSEIAKNIETLLEKVPYSEVGLKIVLTGGVSSDLFMPSNAPTFFLLAYPFIHLPQKLYDEGIAVITKNYSRSLPTIKSIQYLPAILAMKEANEKGASDVLFVSDQGILTEATRANFFAFKGDTLITPARDILSGITREVVLELAQDHFPIEIRDIQLDECSSFTGAFLSSTDKEILPINRINDISLGEIPPSILHLRSIFASYTQKFLHKMVAQ